MVKSKAAYLYNFGTSGLTLITPQKKPPDRERISLWGLKMPAALNIPNSALCARSLDVFETLIFRRLGSPEAVFLCLGRSLQRQGLIKQTAEVFAHARSDAERRAFANAGGLDSTVDLDRIYEELRWSLGLGPQQAAACLDAELELEAALMRHPARSRGLLAAATDDDITPTLISDTYLNAEQVRRLLEVSGTGVAEAKLYVSSELAKSKHSSALFDHVSRDLGGARLHHVGNHPISDFRVPRNVGHSAAHFGHGNLNRYERILEKARTGTGGLSSAFAGASRLARLSLTANDPQAGPRWDFACSVAAPVIVSLALWALVRAKNAGMKRIYFAARDGFQIRRAAEVMSRRLGWGIDVRYLHCSRQAWVPAAIDHTSRDLVELALGAADVPFSVRSGLARLNLAPEVIADELAANGHPESAWNDVLSSDQRPGFVSLLAENRSIFAKICENAAEQRGLVLDYLEQKGMLDGEPFAFFDLGSRRTLLRCLRSFLGDAAPAMLGLYAGVTKSALDVGSTPVEYFLYGDRYGCRDIKYWHTFMETVLCADHGTTLGYRRSKAGVQAVTAETRAIDGLADWAGAFARASETFAQELVLNPDLVEVEADLRRPLLAAVDQFWTKPAVHEATMLGKFPFEDGWGTHGHVVSIVRPIGIAELVGMLSNRSSRRHRHRWVQGSVVLSPWPVRAAYALHKLRETLLGVSREQLRRRWPSWAQTPRPRSTFASAVRVPEAAPQQA